MPSRSLWAWMASVIPRPAKRSPILPTASTGTPAAWSRSSTVGRGGGSEKSRRRSVRTNRPGGPINGRAITRPTPCGPVRISRAIRQYRYSSSTGMRSSCAAIWKTLSADV